MPATYYNTVNGRIRGATKATTRSDYLEDAQGSVTATVNSSGLVENTYRYKPYGATLAKTGTAADPSFRWNGGTGSRATGRRYSEQYNQARHYSSTVGSWTSIDPIWPGQSAYVYTGANPATFVDPTGLIQTIGNGCPSDMDKKVGDACKSLSDALKDKRPGITECMRGKGMSDQELNDLLNCMGDNCNSDKRCFLCSSGVNIGKPPSVGYPPDWPRQCPPTLCLPAGPGKPSPTSGATPFPIPGKPPGTIPPGCKPYGDDEKPCIDQLAITYPQCNNITVICTNHDFFGGPGGPEWLMTVMHEMIHACSRLQHKGKNPFDPPKKPTPPDFIDQFECCLCKQMPWSKDCGPKGTKSCP